LSRVFSTQSIGTQRTRLSKSIVLSIREILKKQAFDQEIKELVAYIIIALLAIDETVEASIGPWEKRGYWVKADRFRLDWDWTVKLANKLKTELNNNNWDEIIPILIEVGLKFNKIQVSDRHRMGKPWLGAWDEYKSRELHLDD
jgi:hypothetical protein